MVILTSSSNRGSLLVPNIILASGSAISSITFAASCTSRSVKLDPPVITNKMRLAPSIAISNSGLFVAIFAASAARVSPFPFPMAIQAGPAPANIVFTSAKSTLISPGTVTTSAIA